MRPLDSVDFIFIKKSYMLFQVINWAISSSVVDVA